MLKTLRIDLTQEDIDLGTKERRTVRNNHGLTCPVGRASTRAFGIPVWATSTELKKAKDLGEGTWSWEETLTFLPPAVQDFIRRFDEGLTVVPMTFEVTYD